MYFMSYLVSRQHGSYVSTESTFTEAHPLSKIRRWVESAEKGVSFVLLSWQKLTDEDVAAIGERTESDPFSSMTLFTLVNTR